MQEKQRNTSTLRCGEPQFRNLNKKGLDPFLEMQVVKDINAQGYWEEPSFPTSSQALGMEGEGCHW